MTDLVERLRAKARASFEANKSFGRRGKEWAIDTETEWQAAAEIERLREALRPFADHADHYDHRAPSATIGGSVANGLPTSRLTIAHLRAARAALSKASGEGV